VELRRYHPLPAPAELSAPHPARAARGDPRFYRGGRLAPELIELCNAVQAALLVVHAASLNPRSRGCHWVEDEAG
jgi:aspartate oxidase